MNLQPPPDQADLEQLRKWCNELYEFLKFPAFHVVRFVPRDEPADESQGNVYFDYSLNKLVVYTNDWTPLQTGTPDPAIHTEAGDDITMESGNVIDLE